jgi:hypothetical protein
MLFVVVIKLIQQQETRRGTSKCTHLASRIVLHYDMSDLFSLLNVIHYRGSGRSWVGIPSELEMRPKVPMERSRFRSFFLQVEGNST